MPCCAVAGCSNHSRHSKETGISFHRFPTDIDLRKQWVNACKRADEFKVDNAKVCSAHFGEHDFERDLKSELLNTKSRRILKNTAVPFFGLSNLNERAISRLKRVESRETKKQISNIFCEIANIDEPSDAIPESTNDENLIVNDKSESEYNLLLNKQLAEAIAKISVLENKLKSYESLFTKSQQQYILQGQCRSWSQEDVSKAITLRCISKKAFSFVRDVLKHPLPSETTIKRRLSHFSIKPGFIDMSLKVMETQVNVFSDFEKNVVLCYDEMKVNSDLCYDNVEDRILGPYSMVQVIVVRSIVGKWKQPVFL
ncbi:LOW QUALITY PROTEIN: uncharacterized protein LOC124371772 [Homalodisca vitripennis]|uniref:LOW QUALITY PROTEIN: uncharacterized protein LOC124371772 n=1 Tax=Homalodisca vitripennis TaxID=197043 RepID=UPI001EEAB9A6|nr:LOW QUALITY PROTEIN: uncharacterized protein LOC124371772 [Homalodisca vitripennis]